MSEPAPLGPGPGEEPTPTPTVYGPPAYAPYPPPPPVVVARPPRPRWLLPTLVGVAGLVIGLLIGGLGVAAVERGRPGSFPGDNRGRFAQVPFRGGPRPGARPFRPVRPAPTAKPSPAAS